ncbi:hypothetical protein [Streptomyces chartreusis]|uniref:hypothetical protein n=1 Tax=Streptomyces chartreusis TaxID=1969 RepID=UPI0037FFE4DA
MSTELVTAVVLGLVVNELCDISPWLARKVIVLAARCVPNCEVRERLEEEWTAGLHDRPGKILKLVAALTILASALTTVRGMYGARRPRLHRARRFLGKYFDREGRLVLVMSTVAAATQAYLEPFGESFWGAAATYGIVWVGVSGADLWWQVRARRRSHSRGV